MLQLSLRLLPLFGSFSEVFLIDLKELLIGLEFLQPDILDDLLDHWFLDTSFGRLWRFGLLSNAFEKRLIVGVMDKLFDNLIDLLMNFMIQFICFLQALLLWLDRA